MITNPESSEGSTLTELDACVANKSPASSATSTTASNPASSGDQLLMPANPFESHGQRYEDDFDIPPLPPHDQQQQQQQHQQQQMQQQAYYQQQQHDQYYHHQQQQQYYHQQQQQQQHGYYDGYHQQHAAMQQQQQQGAYAGMYAHGNGAGGGMYPPAPAQPGQAGYPNGTSPPNNATPSPTTNSDDSGGDCVNEKSRLMHARTVMPQAPGQPPVVHPYYAHHMGQRGVPVVQKRPRQTRRNKKKRDPNEPQKPVSAYALFFRDMQAGIKQRNPNASFGEVSKHVASMWDNLDPDHKAAYKKRTENAKKEYLKQLAAYRANLVSKNGNCIEPYGPYSAAYSCFAKSGEYVGTTYANSSGEMLQNHRVGPLTSPAASSDGGGVNNNVSGSPYMRGHETMRQTHHMPPHGHHSPSTGPPPGSPTTGRPTTGYPSPATSSSSLAVASTAGAVAGSNGTVASPASSAASDNGDASAAAAAAPTVTRPACRRPGCANPISDYGMNGFCSNDCVLSQSREIYNSWSSNGTGPPPPQAQAAAVAGGPSARD